MHEASLALVEAPSIAADPYARPRGFKSARIGGEGTISQITIPAAPVTFSVLLSGDVDPRDMMLAEPNLSATFESSEYMGTTTAEPQAVPEKKMRSADDASSVESEDETNAITSGPDSGRRHMLNDRRKRELGKMRRIISAGEHERPLSIAAETRWK